MVTGSYINVTVNFIMIFDNGQDKKMIHYHACQQLLQNDSSAMKPLTLTGVILQKTWNEKIKILNEYSNFSFKYINQELYFESRIKSYP